MNVAVRIQHAPQRAALLPDLYAALDGFDDVQVVCDPYYGTGRETWPAHQACLEATPAGATHLLVVQDDALPCDAFNVKTLAAIGARPNDLLVLFAPGFGFIRTRMLEAARQGRGFMRMPQTAFTPTVAIVYPRPLVEKLLAWAGGEGWPAAQARVLRGADDGVVARFVRAHRLSVWATVPCLVDHRVDVPSLARPSHRDGAHRRAALSLL